MSVYSYVCKHYLRNSLPDTPYDQEDYNTPYCPGCLPYRTMCDSSQAGQDLDAICEKLNNTVGVGIAVKSEPCSWHSSEGDWRFGDSFKFSFGSPTSLMELSVPGWSEDEGRASSRKPVGGKDLDHSPWSITAFPDSVQSTAMDGTVEMDGKAKTKWSDGRDIVWSSSKRLASWKPDALLERPHKRARLQQSSDFETPEHPQYSVWRERGNVIRRLMQRTDTKSMKHARQERSAAKDSRWEGSVVNF